MSLCLNDINFLRVTGTDIQPHLPALAQLRIDVFRAFPYLYDGDLAYEENYLRTYSECSEAVIVLAMHNGEVVGASTAIPMRHETAEFQQPLREHGYNPERVFYCGESVLRAPYRGIGIGGRFFDEREAHAQALGGFDWIAFCAVQRPHNHPLRPADYTPLDAFWQSRGFVCHPELVTDYVWKDIDCTQATAKPMVYWLKPVNY